MRLRVKLDGQTLMDCSELEILWALAFSKGGADLHWLKPGAVLTVEAEQEHGDARIAEQVTVPELDATVPQ